MEPENPSNISDTDYRYWLSVAALSANRALAALEASDGPKRSHLHRYLLSRASSILSGLYLQEKQREMNGEYASSKRPR